MTYHRDRVALTRGAVDGLFAERIDRGRAPASSYAVFDTDGIVYAGGFGDRGDGRPPTPDTAFRIASCTKSLTAAALLVLVERGLVGVDDPVDRILSVGALTGPDGATVSSPTLRQLVGMGAGLPTDDAWADRQESLSAEEFHRLVAAGIRFARPPGQAYEYSNLGFALVGAVIEKVSGRSLVDFVTEELIIPLGLDGVAFDSAVPAADGVATGFARVDDAWVAQPVTTPGAFSAIGGAFATPRSLARWAGWLSAAVTAADDQDQPLSRAGRLLMQTGQTPVDTPTRQRQSYGMGLVTEEHPRHGTLVWHNGGYPGFGAHLRWHRESGIGILALENGRYSTPRTTAAEALGLVLDETIIAASEPLLWPETRSARDAVERLVRQWDDALAEQVLADNVDLDEPLTRRARAIAELAAAVVPMPEPLPLADSSPYSETPAHLAWTMPGREGCLRCEITLTPTEPPMIQTLDVRRG